LARIETASNAAFFAPAAPIASVPTGIPAGICTIESSESMPDRALLCTGTPKTGKTVCEAVMPGRCAAPPAPAIITSTPRHSACLANSKSKSGVRCAETTRVSCATPKSFKTSDAFRIVSQSDVLPIIIATSGFSSFFIAYKIEKMRGESKFGEASSHARRHGRVKKFY
jgi:hypothetical protein